MYLVSVHAHVSKVARTLLSRALMAIVEIIAAECLACFGRIPRFGMGGMLRVRLAR
jgi:exocyst complex component 2